MTDSPSPAGIIRTHVFISGKVQGVGYRFSTVEMAQRYGVKGWVRNLPDRRVEAVFEGEPRAVESLLDWCHQGPPAAVVDAVETHSETPEGFSRFEVKR
ncbi:MAG: acylphosphatase [Desertifilum sp. SIO1I2]|nr:acylphosphatase [Desertifilum sp. SIO1I2]